MVVDSGGTPQDVHVVKSIAESSPKLRSVAQGLDANAINAAKQYRFKPATYQGKPVPYELKVEINYDLLIFSLPSAAVIQGSGLIHFPHLG